MLSIAVCDDEIIECCNMAGKLKNILEEMKIPYKIRQFQSGRIVDVHWMEVLKVMRENGSIL